MKWDKTDPAYSTYSERNRISRIRCILLLCRTCSPVGLVRGGTQWMSVGNDTTKGGQKDAKQALRGYPRSTDAVVVSVQKWCWAEVETEGPGGLCFEK